jgi:hypothetical protein
MEEKSKNNNENQKIEDLKKEYEERIKMLEEKVNNILSCGRIHWFSSLRDYIEKNEIVTRIQAVQIFKSIKNSYTEMSFLSQYPEIKKIRLPRRGEGVVYVYLGKNFHPAKLLINNWNILIERKGLPFALIEKKEKCPEEHINALKKWCKKHLSKWLIVNNEGVYKK